MAPRSGPSPPSNWRRGDREAIARAGIDAEGIDYVAMGHVLQAAPARSRPAAAIAAGVPKEVPAITLNNVCLSSRRRSRWPTR